MKSESIKELAIALAKVKFGEIAKSKTVKVLTKSGSTYNFEYAPLEDIMSAIRKPLAEQGLSLSQSVTTTAPMGVYTRLLHNSGEWMDSFSPIVVKDGCTAQEMGSAITYARRYGVTLICCLVADEDDDANIADGNEVKSRPFSSPHKPTDGAWEAMSEEEQVYLTGIAMDVIAALSANNVPHAYGLLENAGLDGDEKTAIWTRFDSKQRAALKKYGESLKKES